MSKKLYFTFDEYYNVDMYNNFLSSAKNNGIDYEEYIKIRPPYNRYIGVDSTKNLPSYVDYDLISTSDERFLVSAVKAVRPNEAYILKRREGKDRSYWDYINPKPLIDMHKKDYIIVFKAFSNTELINLSKKVGKSKIYKWGKAEIKGYDIYISFNPYVKSFISERNILLEFGEGATSGLKHNSVVPNIPGDIEYMLNHYVLVKEKLENKTYELTYYQNGIIHPIKKETFI